MAVLATVRRWRSLAVIVTIVAWNATAGAQEFDPAHAFRTIRTPHFAIHFHQAEEAMAANLTDIAEAIWHDADATTTGSPPAFTHVVLTDQTELPNGYATTLPRNTIVLYAAAPSGDSTLDATNWLRVVFTHEFAHIVHLDRTRGWARLARGIFGRAPWTFPNLLLPAWQVEGLATYQESAMTGGGRQHAGEFRSILREAARTGRLHPIDRVGGGLIDWPGGHAAYAYGLGFHQWLAERFGASAFDTLATKTAGSLPWLGLLAFDDVYGASLTELWRQYQATLTASAGALVAETPATTVRRLTRHGHVVTAPRYVRASCNGCVPDILYSVRTPHDFPALQRYDRSSATSERVTTRNFGSTAAWRGDTIVFDQLEVERGAGLYSDLYAFDTARRRVTRLTRDARLLDPDLAPDGRTIAAVRNAAGRRDLVTMPIDETKPERATAPAMLVSTSGTYFNAPRWSPDGRAIAVERQRTDARSEIVIVDPVSRDVRVVAAGGDVQWITPAWRPDGRAIVAAASRGDGPFVLHEITLADGMARPIPTLPGGATWPDVSPDGTWIVFAGYGPDGFDVHEIAYDIDRSPLPAVRAVETDALSGAAQRSATARPVSPDAGAHASEAGGDVANARAYSPWSTLAPTSWSPILSGTSEDLRAGARLAGTDVLTYHAYDVSATWPLHVSANAENSSRVPDWTASYAYRRHVPRFWIAAGRETSYDEGPPDAAGLATAATVVQRVIEAGVQIPYVRVRHHHALRISYLGAVDDYGLDGVRSRRRHSAARIAWSLSSARVHGYSISPERGVAAGVTLETSRRRWGATADVTTATADARLYVPGLADQHVLAVRFAGGVAREAGAATHVFLLGGAGANARTDDFDSDAMSLLRGFPDDTFAGRRVALLNVDYRLPLARPQRGLATWPLFLRTIHAAVVVDAGHAWMQRFTLHDAKLSVGAELSADVVLGYGLPLTMTVGVARGHDGSGAVPDATTGYARIGYAF